MSDNAVPLARTDSLPSDTTARERIDGLGARVHAPPVRPLGPVLALLAAFVYVVAPHGGVSVALADCSTDDPLCLELEPPRAAPGSVVRVGLVPEPCDEVEGGVIYLFEDLEGGLQVGAPLRLTADGRAKFVVPQMPPSEYGLAVDCPPGPTPVRLASTFTVLRAPPNTATADFSPPERAPSDAAVALAVAIAAVVGTIAGLRRTRENVGPGSMQPRDPRHTRR